MNDLRTAAQQALEAMEYTGLDVGKFNRINSACAALRAALAQEQAEPTPGEYHGWVLREVLFDRGEPVGHREPAQEPVAWRCACGANLYIDENGAPRSKA